MTPRAPTERRRAANTVRVRPTGSVWTPTSASRGTSERPTRATPARELRPTRAGAIWRDAAIPTNADEGAEEHAASHAQIGGRVFVSWRAISGLMVAALGLIMALLFASDTFYVNTISVTGLDTLTRDDVFTLSGLRQLHLFWVDPVEVERALLQSPAIATARVLVNMPPDGVQIVIQEREPALIWEQAGLVSWVDVVGRVMQPREDRPSLLRITADPDIDGAPPATIERDIVTGALQLHQLLTDVPSFRYHPDKGLGYNDPRGWEAWFGTGTTMPQRVTVYRAIIADLARRGIPFREVNVTDPDAPVYCCRGN
jgi:hypothetical protein